MHLIKNSIDFRGAVEIGNGLSVSQRSDGVTRLRVGGPGSGGPDGDDPDLWLWVRAKDLLLTHSYGDNFGTWPDVGSKGNDLTQSNGAKQIALKSVDDMPVVESVSPRGPMTSPTLFDPSLTGATIFVVAKKSGPHRWPGELAGFVDAVTPGDIAGEFTFIHDGWAPTQTEDGNFYWTDDDSDVPVLIGPNTEFGVMTIILNGSLGSMRFNGVPMVTNFAVHPGSLVGLKHWFISWGGNSGTVNAQHKEHIVYSGVLSDERIEEHESYLKAEHKIGQVISSSGFKYIYSTDTANTDPGAGKLKFDSATLASAVSLRISETDGLGHDLAAWLATWDNSTSTIKGTLTIKRTPTLFGVPVPGKYFATYKITGTIADNGTWDSFDVTFVASSGTFNDGDSVDVLFDPTGDVGPPGGGALEYTYLDDTANSDPGSGNLKFDDADPTSAVVIRISKTDAAGANVAAILATWDDSDSAVKGNLTMRKIADPSTWVSFQIYGASDAGSYVDFAIGSTGIVGSFTDGDGVYLEFVRTGDVGDPGDAGANGTSDDPLTNPPGSPSAYDDEFEGSSLDAKWTLNPLVTAAPIAVAVSHGRCSIAPSDYATTGVRLYGIAQVLSGSGDFKIWAKISSPVPGTNSYDGLIVGKSGGSAKGWVFGIGANGGFTCADMEATYGEGASDWSAFTGGNSVGVANFHLAANWYRIRWVNSTTTLYFDYSIDGDTWINFASHTMASRPDRIGLGMYQTSAAGWALTKRLNARCFRYEANANF